MENTLENKAVFFALYFGQEVRVWQEMPESLCNVGYAALQPEAIPCSHLELTPLSQISDEDLEEIGFGRVKGKKVDFHFESYDMHWTSSCGNYGTLLYKHFQHLISKGYAIPFRGVDVETLISWGWVKLKTEKE